MAQSFQHRQESESGRTAHDVAEAAKSQFGRIADSAAGNLQSTAHQAEEVAKQALERGREAGENLKEVGGNFKNAIQKSVESQPLTTLVAAAAVGFILGALWRK